MLTVLRSQSSARPRHSPRTAARRTAPSRPVAASRWWTAPLTSRRRPWPAIRLRPIRPTYPDRGAAQRLPQLGFPPRRRGHRGRTWAGRSRARHPGEAGDTGTGPH